jgi:hypothetical protein
LLAAGEKREMKEIFVTSCFDSGVNANASVFKTETDQLRLKDYCKCVFDITTEKINVNDLMKANMNDKSAEYKSFMQKMQPSIKACTYHFE